MLPVSQMVLTVKPCHIKRRKISQSYRGKSPFWVSKVAVSLKSNTWGRQHLRRRTFLTSILHQIVCSCTKPWGSREDWLSYLNTSGQLCVRKTNAPVHPFQEASWSPEAWDFIRIIGLVPHWTVRSMWRAARGHLLYWRLWRKGAVTIVD